jgi:4-amino-4-deoxy-L-arabinose transferase-like glycosyltransferase
MCTDAPFTRMSAYVFGDHGSTCRPVAGWISMRPLLLRSLLILILALAATLRLPALATFGFSEDESAKVQAIDAYRHGDFTANAEHPMLMKLAMWGTTSAANRWNAISRPAWRMAPESALRLPNAIAGVVTVLVVYGVARLLFAPAVGLAAAAIVALDPNIIALNRIGKEDTFLMLFFLLAVFCYERAKTIIGDDYARAQRWYLLCGGCFGLMLASKYMPHFYGLYALFNVSTVPDGGGTGPRRLRMHAVMAAAFLAANPAILFPATWTAIVAYLHGGTLMHHGEMYGNQLYVTNVPLSFAGVPFTYYVNMIATKVPMPVLAAALVGIVPLVTRRHERGFVWLRVFLVFILLGYSVIAAKFQRYGLPMLLFVDVLAAVGLVATVKWLWQRPWHRPLRVAAGAAAYAALIVTLMADTLSVAPFFSVHQNAWGARLAPPVSVFPEEAYDYGIREAVAEIARRAPHGAVIVSDATAVVEYYLARDGRPDLRARSLSMEGMAPRGEQWVFVQNDHIYFENASAVERLRRARTPWRRFRIRNTPVLDVFHLPA